MLYLLDIHHKPPMVVLATEDKDEIGKVGQAYANQVSRPLVVATGPHPDNAHFKPDIPTFAASEVLIPADPRHVAPDVNPNPPDVTLGRSAKAD